MKEKFLPIGSVVLLKEATKRIMITGYCSTVPEQPNVTYDYTGVLFPEGNLAGDDIALFNHEQIASIPHVGLEDEEFKNLDAEIKQALAEEAKNPTSQDDPRLGILAGQKLSDLPAPTPETLNNMLNAVKPQLPTAIQEPGGFSEATLSVPTFGATAKKEEKEVEEETQKLGGAFSLDPLPEAGNAVAPAPAPVNDGTPVLQLELAGGSGAPVGGTSGSAPVAPPVFRL